MERNRLHLDGNLDVLQRYIESEPVDLDNAAHPVTRDTFPVLQHATVSDLLKRSGRSCPPCTGPHRGKEADRHTMEHHGQLF